MKPQIIKEGRQYIEGNMDLTMDMIVQVIYECETWCNQASQTIKASVIWKAMSEI